MQAIDSSGNTEKTLFFSVNQNGQFYKCFGCQKSGDVISFIQEKERLEFVDAVIFLANRAMIPLPEKKENSVEEKKVQEEKDILMRINLEAARFFRECLWKNLFALEYLKKRDLNREIILHFGLRYADALVIQRHAGERVDVQGDARDAERVSRPAGSRAGRSG